MVSVLVMFAAFLLYCHKVDLSVNIVCMVNHSGLAHLSNQTVLYKSDKDGPFIWTKSQQGFVLTGFFWGYMIAQIPGALMGSRFGVKYTMFAAVLVAGTCAACYKVAAFVSFKLLWALRLIVGLGTGMILPCVSQLWTAWAPKQEKSFLIGFAISGSNLGSVATLPLGGILCVKGIDGGWPSLFYLIALTCGVWCVAWAFLFYDSPAKHPFISQDEKIFISENTSVLKQRQSIVKIPWRKMMTNVPFIADIVCHTCLHWGLYTLLTSTPNFLKDVMHLDIKSNGALSAIPYVCMWVSTSTSGIVMDILIARNYLSTTVARKIANLLGSIPVAACLIGLAYVGKSQTSLAIILLAVSQAFYGIAFGSGYIVVPNDIAGPHAGLAFGIANTVGSIPGLITPYLTAFMTKNKTQAEWQKVFLVAAAMYIIAGISFSIFGSARLQDFGKVEPGQTKDPEEMKPMKT